MVTVQVDSQPKLYYDYQQIMRFARTILLTGAGFTKSFGGFLASEMWAKIFNQSQVRTNQGLRELMLKSGFNYEVVYEDVLTSSIYTALQKSAFNEAIKISYEEMDSAIYEWRQGYVTGSLCCIQFVERFSRVRDGRVFFFTLNQDIFIERFFSTANSILTIPGLKHCPKWFNNHLGPVLLPEDYVTLPTGPELENIKQKFWTKGAGKFMYVKLHGSFGWRAHDGSEVLVIGQGKEGRIRKEPLLDWYLSLFEEALQEGDKNLVVIGYGFGDGHINEVIANAIQSAGLRLFVISPRQPEEFYLELTNLDRYKPKADEIWKGMFGYYHGEVTSFYRIGDSNLPACGQKLFSDLNL
jgi:SIR2-like domain